MKKEINYKKFWYKLNNKIKRLFKRQPLIAFFITSNVLLEMAKAQTVVIGCQPYFEVERVGISINHKTGEMKEIIIKKNKKSKQDFEAEKALKIVDVWINCAESLCNLWGGKVKFPSIKETVIKQLLLTLNKIIEKKNDL